MPTPELMLLVDDIDSQFQGRFKAYSGLWDDSRVPEALDPNVGSASQPSNGHDNTTRLKYSGLSSRFPHAPQNAISMWIADMDVPPLSAISEAISAFALSHYGYQDIDISNAVTQRYAKQGLTISPQSVISCASVMSAVDIALSVSCNKGDKVMVLSPTYGPLRERIHAQHLHIVDVPITAGSDYGDSFGAINLQHLDPDCSAFVLCHPNNPTGTVISDAMQRHISAFCLQHNIVLIIDEVHSEFGFSDAHCPKPISPFAMHDIIVQNNIIRINGAAKAFNLSALPGASFATISNVALRKKFAQEVDARHLEASPIAKVALVTAYERGDEWLNTVRNAISVNRQYTKALIAVLCPSAPYTLGEAGYFLWLNLTNIFPNETFKHVCEKGVIGVDGAQFNAPHHVRLNLACHPSLIKIALLRLFNNTEGH